MMNRKLNFLRWIGRGTAMLLLLGCLSLLQISATRGGTAQTEAALEVANSRHYELHSNLDRADKVEIARHMDAVFDEYDRRFSAFRPRGGAGTMALYVVNDQDEYLKLLAEAGINARNTGGMFVVRPQLKGLLTWSNGKSRSETYGVLQHEGFHQFAFTYFGTNLPTWVNEGLAQYFEDGLLVNGKFLVGWADANRIASVKKTLQDKNAVDFNDLLTMTNERWSEILSKDARQSSLLYDQAWSVVYFLIHADKGKYRNAFEQYLGLIARGNDASVASRKAFGTDDTKAFEARWREYMLALQPDSLNIALERMAFLAQAIKFLQAKQQKTPRDIDDLEATLKKLGYSAWRSTNNIKTEFKAADRTMYEYPMPEGNKSMRFEILPPQAPGLPARLRATQLTPQPTLIWSLSNDKTLTQDIEFN